MLLKVKHSELQSFLSNNFDEFDLFCFKTSPINLVTACRQSGFIHTIIRFDFLSVNTAVKEHTLNLTQNSFDRIDTLRLQAQGTEYNAEPNGSERVRLEVSLTIILLSC